MTVVQQPRVIGRPSFYGTAWKGGRTAGFVRQALAAGYRGFDTAGQPVHYYEPVWVRAWPRRWRKTTRATKSCFCSRNTRRCWPRGKASPATLITPGRAGRAIVDTVIRNLGTGYLDSYLLRAPQGAPGLFAAMPVAIPCRAPSRNQRRRRALDPSRLGPEDGDGRTLFGEAVPDD